MPSYEDDRLYLSPMLASSCAFNVGLIFISAATAEFVKCVNLPRPHLTHFCNSGIFHLCWHSCSCPTGPAIGVWLNCLWCVTPASISMVHCIKQVTLLYRLGKLSWEAGHIQCRSRWGVSGPPIRGVASHHHMLPVHSRTHPVTMLHVPLAPILLKCTSRTHPVTVLHVPLAPILSPVTVPQCSRGVCTLSVPPVTSLFTGCFYKHKAVFRTVNPYPKE